MFGVPTYFFIFAILALIVTGFVRVLVFGYQPPEPTAVIETAGDVTVFLILRAFASDCTALTGVEGREQLRTLTVMMGALVVTSPLKKLLHNQTTQRLSKKLERYRNVSVFTVPYII